MEDIFLIFQGTKKSDFESGNQNELRKIPKIISP